MEVSLSGCARQRSGSEEESLEQSATLAQFIHVPELGA